MLNKNFDFLYTHIFSFHQNLKYFDVIIRKPTQYIQYRNFF